ncbi:Rrf2 family transcriptional regulator [[Bacteroides] pectinophilus]|jgi:Rrf2 family protein|uniref:Rrf2 family transcriptional regulator n=1 Tax=[Bacteroides] pectinophilus ATCC 43243 TaxID=483218 RepID=B7AR82_9FIRM|nr:transcriptional regulator, Rrf2 family [[Bacteroides] pectinophilus ATCC 43243]UWN96596.1 Rrf2 family transcriptional regulator [[Bacteroides] pectinophilus]HBH93742.1 Rrf2 family transcriptional regulator [Bacteroides sp.]
MMISTKGRYALRVMTDLAQHGTGDFIPLKEISARQGISLKYLESIMTILSKGHMVRSASGKGGGYCLIKSPEEYRVGDILRLTEGDLAPVACLAPDTKKCDLTNECYTLPFWKGLGDAINEYLDGHTLADLVSGSSMQHCTASHDNN